MFVCAECGQRHDQPGYCPADGRPLVATDDPLLGTDVGRYRLASLLGECHERIVALERVAKLAFEQIDALDRLGHEAVIAAGLANGGHPAFPPTGRARRLRTR